MFKAARWRSEKCKIRAVFKLQFQATQVPKLGWEAVMVTLVPMEVGRPTSRSEKAAVIDGQCHWASPIYETVKLSQDPKTGKINDKVYQFLVSATGSTKSGVLGEITVNLAEYAEAFKPSNVSRPLNASNTGAILHVTVQRMQGDAEGRVADDNGDVVIKKQRRTLQSQLSINDDGEGRKDHNSTNDINSIEDGSFMNIQSRVKFPSSRNLLRADSDGNLTKYSSYDAISASGSDTSSGQHTPNESGIKSTTTYQDSASFLSRLSSGDTPQKGIADHQRSNTNGSVNSAPDGSTSGSTSSSGETGSSERLQESDEKLGGDIVSLRRQLEVSELELQTLRKQVVKENRRGQDLSRDLSRLKEERAALARECEELKGLLKRTNDDDKLGFDGEDPWSMLEEAKQEINYEKNLNANLHLQLQKTQESNSELILAVRDLDELLEQKNREMSCIHCSMDGEAKESKQELFETASGNEEQYDLEKFINSRDDAEAARSLEQQIIDLSSVVDLYKKDREDIEMQMEQLALDYEIMKQENHEISSKLEQTQLREQLRMQYECSGHLAIINDLETYAESLENDLQTQAEAFEADLEAITNAKVGQEQRAIQAEEALRKMRTNNAGAAERLHDEFKRLCGQMSSAFCVNEKLVTEAVAESGELRLQKRRLEDLLEKSNAELASVKGQYCVKIQQLLCLVDFKTREADKLLLELKDKRKELENQKKSEETKQRASSEEMMLLKAEMEKLLRENKHLSEQLEDNEAEMEQMKTEAKESEMLLHGRNLEGDTLQIELVSMRKEANKTQDELNDLIHMKDEKETMIRNLNSEAETLRREYSNLMRTLSEDDLEKEKLKQWVSHLKGDLQKKEDMVTSLQEKTQLLEGEIKLKDVTVGGLRNSFLQKEKDHRNKIEEIERSMREFSRKNQGLSKGMVHKGNLYNGQHEEKDIAPSFEQLSSASLQEECNVDKNIVENKTSGVGDNDNRLLQSRIEDKACINIGANTEKEEETLMSCSCGQEKICEILSEMALLKERNQSMEVELKEMQERYSDMSLKFAEVEGERQQLVISIRTLKNALKT